jgi:hypothetical protein
MASLIFTGFILNFWGIKKPCLAGADRVKKCLYTRLYHRSLPGVIRKMMMMAMCELCAHVWDKGKVIRSDNTNGGRKEMFREE